MLRAIQSIMLRKMTPINLLKYIELMVQIYTKYPFHQTYKYTCLKWPGRKEEQTVIFKNVMTHHFVLCRCQFSLK